MVFEGLWAGRRCSAWSGRRRSLAGCAGLSTAPRGVPLSTCAWPPAPATAGGLHRRSGGYGNATEAHRGVVTAVGAVAVDWPSQAAAEAFGGAS